MLYNIETDLHRIINQRSEELIRSSCSSKKFSNCLDLVTKWLEREGMKEGLCAVECVVVELMY